jgi:preprotein translocase subunit SecG
MGPLLSLDGLTKAILLTVGILYALGLVAVNAFLLRLGITDFELVRPRFIATGLLMVLPMALSFAIPIFVFPWGKPLIRIDPSRRLRSIGDAGMSVFGLGVIQVLPLLYYVVFALNAPPQMGEGTFNRFILGLDLWLTALMVSLLLIFLIAMVSGHWDGLLVTLGQKPDTATVAERTKAVGLIGLTVLLLVAFHVWSFVEAIYPKVPQQFGGGAPVAATLVSDPLAGEVLSALGVSTIGSGAQRIPASVYLERDDEYVVVLKPGGSVVRIGKDLIAAVETEPLP